jgi:hypothetical protein
VPFSNFFEFGYFKTLSEFASTKHLNYIPPSNIAVLLDGRVLYPYLLRGGFYNKGLRYQVNRLESTRSVSNFLNETHIGYTGRKLSQAGGVLDFRFDALIKSRGREPRYFCDRLV